MQRPADLELQRRTKWNSLLSQMEIKYKSAENHEGVVVTDLLKQLPEENTFKGSWIWKINDKSFHIPNLRDRLALKTRTKTYCTSDSKENRIQQNHKHMNSKRRRSELFASYNNSVKKSTDNKTVEGVSKNTGNMHKNVENNCTKDNPRRKRKIDNISLELMKANDFRKPFEQKLSFNNNNNIKNIDVCEDVSSGYISENTSGGSTLTVDMHTVQLILNIIDSISEQNRPNKDILTKRKLNVLDIDITVSPVEKKCIRFYTKEKQFKISKQFMFKLVHLMDKKENKNIQKCILGMELYRSLNIADCAKFKFLQSELTDAITKFLQFNDVEILKIFIDYILCTFYCRTRRTKF